MTPRPIVIGAGVNGLAAAFYLARAGLRPLVLERSDRVGGAASTRELVPGVRVPDLTHAVGPIRQDIAEAMGLASHGVKWLRPSVDSFTPDLDGRALVLPRDSAAAAAAIGQFSARDASRYPQFLREIGSIGGVVSALLAEVPLSIDTPTTGELWRLLQIGRRFRRLGREQVFRALRWGPMPVADLLTDVFETELLRATLATRGVFASALGPRSAGTAAALILEGARQPSSPFAPVFVQGGPGQLASAMAAAATAAGAEIRCGAGVLRIDVDDSGVRGVTLSNGDQIAATTVVSNADPQRTLLGLVDPVRLEPDVILRIRNYRARGTVAKVNLVMNGLPSFTGLRNLPAGLTADHALERPHPDRTHGGRHRTRVRRVEIRTVVGEAVARMRHPDVDGLHHRTAWHARHVHLRSIRAVPAAGWILGRGAQRISAGRRRPVVGICGRPAIQDRGRGDDHTSGPRIDAQLHGRTHSPR